MASREDDLLQEFEEFEADLQVEGGPPPPSLISP